MRCEGVPEGNCETTRCSLWSLDRSVIEQERERLPERVFHERRNVSPRRETWEEGGPGHREQRLIGHDRVDTIGLESLEDLGRVAHHRHAMRLLSWPGRMINPVGRGINSPRNARQNEHEKRTRDHRRLRA